MTRRFATTLFAGSLLLQAQKKNSQQKGPEIELLEATAQLDGNRVNIDGRVKNVSEKPVRKLNVVFEILDPANNVLTRQQGPIEEAMLEPGDEGSFHAQMAWHARSHAYRLSFEDGSGKELRAEKTGPFTIE